MKKKIILTMALGLIGATAANAVLVVGELQATEGNVVPAPIDAIGGDLLETQFGSVIGGMDSDAILRDGVAGASRDSGTMSGLWFDQNGSLQTDYYFDLTSNTLGYDIEDIRVFTGWDSNRAQAGYEISYSLVGSAAFISLGTVLSPSDQGADNSADDWSFVTRTYDDAGGIIGLSGVDAIRFDWDFTDNANGGTRGPVMREIDIIGVAVPEPATLGLVAVFGAGVLFIRRRFMK